MRPGRRHAHRGNRHLTQAERDKRTVPYYAPYLRRYRSQGIDRALAQGIAPVLLSMHSYTPVWKGTQRPWHGAVLWDRDPRLARPVLSQLSSRAGICERRQRALQRRPVGRLHVAVQHRVRALRMRWSRSGRI